MHKQLSRVRTSSCAVGVVRVASVAAMFLSIAMLMLCRPGLAHAEIPVVSDSDPDLGGFAAAPVWTFGGFGSVGVAHSSEHHADYTGNALNPGRAGYSQNWSPDADSRLGGQLDARFNRQWSAVLQMVAERHLDGTYAPRVEWANLKYNVTPDLALRVGRIALPLFLAADYSKANYALPWVRPPVEIYGAVPLSSSDGVDATYRWQTGDAVNTTQVFYGHADVKLTQGASVIARGIVGLSDTVSIGALSLRAGVMSAVVSVDAAQPLFDAFRQFGVPGAVLADQYDVDRKRVVVSSAGFNYDPGKWFVMGELARIASHTYLGDKTAMYVSSGARFGNFTPYAIYGRSKSNGDTHAAGLAPSGYSPQADAGAAALNTQLNGLMASIAIQQTISLGVRWDCLPSVALKIQYDRVRPQGGSSGTLIDVQPDFQSGQTFSVVSAVLDFVF